MAADNNDCANDGRGNGNCDRRTLVVQIVIIWVLSIYFIDAHGCLRIDSCENLAARARGWTNDQLSSLHN